MRSLMQDCMNRKSMRSFSRRLSKTSRLPRRIKCTSFCTIHISIHSWAEMSSQTNRETEGRTLSNRKVQTNCRTSLHRAHGIDLGGVRHFSSPWHSTFPARVSSLDTASPHIMTSCNNIVVSERKIIIAFFEMSHLQNTAETRRRFEFSWIMQIPM